jgi:ribosomal protein S24E
MTITIKKKLLTDKKLLDRKELLIKIYYDEKPNFSQK